MENENDIRPEVKPTPSRELYSIRDLEWTSEISVTETIRAEGPGGVYIVWKSNDGYSAFIPSFKYKDDKVFHRPIR